MIYHAFYCSEIRWLFGDTNECSPVEAGSQISYDYDRICFVLQMTGKVKTLEYKEGCGRYDNGTYDMLQEFLKTGKINKYIEKPGEFNKNVCYLNKTGIDFNNHCCKKFIEGKQFVEVNFLYNNNREKYPVCEEMPNMCTQNMKGRDFYNTMEFT